MTRTGLIDETSVALVHQLATSGSGFVVLTVRRGGRVPEPITALWKDGLAEWLELSPLARAESHELVTAALGGPVDGTTLHELFNYSRGNVLFLRELIVGGLASGALAAGNGIWRWNGPIIPAPRLAELIEARMAGLDSPQRAALEVVAFGEPVAAQVLDRLDDTAAHLEALERAGLVGAEQSRDRVLVRMAHPLYGEVVRAQTPTLRARTVHRQLAQALAREGDLNARDVLRLATWQLAAGERGDARRLTEAAEHAVNTLDHQRAEQLAQAAITAGAGPAAHRVLAIALARQGRARRAEDVFAAIPTHGPDSETISTAIARAVNLQWRLGKTDQAETVLDRAIATVHDPAARAELSAVKAGFLAYDLRCAGALRIVEPILNDAGSARAARVRALAVAADALALTGQCDTAAVTADQGIDMLAAHPDADALVRLALNMARISADVWGGRLAEAYRRAETGYQAAIERHSSFETAAYGGWLAVAARSQGRLTTARHLLREAVERGRAPDVRAFRRFLPRLLAELARTTAMCGDASTAHAVLREVRTLDNPPSRMGQLWAAMAEPWIAAADAALSRAVTLSVRLADHAGELGLATLELAALHDALRFDPTTQLSTRITQLAATLQGPLPAAYSLHATGLATGDGTGLDTAADHFATCGAHLLAAEAATHAALAHRRRGATTKALASANRARALTEHCEGARTPALRLLEAPPQLTPRERQIAALAARGYTSKDIASQLVISVRTVDNALHEVYTKLGINRRADLSAILGEPQPPPTSLKPSNR
jgi:DNA-binding CsgD family transcriptional regulator